MLHCLLLSPFQYLLEDWIPQRLSFAIFQFHCNPPAPSTRSLSSVGCHGTNSCSSCLWGFWVMSILGAWVCSFTTAHTDPIRTITLSPLTRWPIALQWRTRRSHASRTHKHGLSDHLSYIEAALECKQTILLPLNCLWPQFVFGKGARVRIMGWCCTCYLPS